MIFWTPCKQQHYLLKYFVNWHYILNLRIFTLKIGGWGTECRNGTRIYSAKIGKYEMRYDSEHISQESIAKKCLKRRSEMVYTLNTSYSGSGPQDHVIYEIHY